MLSEHEENFFQIIQIESISKKTEVINCIDLTIEEDESFVLDNGVISHNSAMGSILQKRDSINEGAYALKGKIKNARNLSELAETKEILELMQILNLDPNSPNDSCPYRKIVIAADQDCLHGDTGILTSDGIKKISEILPGDMVMSHSGNYREVKSVYEKKSEEMIEISILGVVVKCTPDHKFPIMRNGEILLEKAKNIKNEDFIFIRKINQEDSLIINPDYIIEKEEEGIFYDIEVEEDHTFFIASEEKGILILSHNCDGYHIASLLINLFYKWFPWIIERKMLYILETPLITTGDKNKSYYYSLEEFKADAGKKKMTNVRYLKGLGSLSLEDWEYVMKNKRLINVVKDKKSGEMLEMAFGKSSELRKQWLSGFRK
jgi:hypothetical protein